RVQVQACVDPGGRVREPAPRTPAGIARANHGSHREPVLGPADGTHRTPVASRPARRGLGQGGIVLSPGRSEGGREIRPSRGRGEVYRGTDGDRAFAAKRRRHEAGVRSAVQLADFPLSAGRISAKFRPARRGRGHRYDTERPCATGARLHVQGSVLLVDRPTGSPPPPRPPGGGCAAEGAVTTAQRVGETASQVLATLFAARARHARGDYAHAIKLLNWVVGATDGDRANFLGMANLPSVSARTWLSWSLAECGVFGLAMVRGDEGVFIAEAVDHLVSRVYAYMALGIVHLRKGDFA